MRNTECLGFSINIRPCGAVDIHEELGGGRTYENVNSAISRLRMIKVLTIGLSAGFYSASFYLGSMGSYDFSNGIINKNLKQATRGAIGILVSNQAFRVGEHFNNVEKSATQKIEVIKKSQNKY